MATVAFDIALLIYYSSHSFYRFVYHDGVLEGLDDRVKQRLIEVTQRVCSEYGLQYILSLIDSDIPKCVGDVDHEFPMRAVCLNLDDLDDNGKLFCVVSSPKDDLRLIGQDTSEVTWPIVYLI